jgi:molecular chaperone HtpG
VEHQFRINLRGIIDLLSNHLYSGPEVFLRELLQNAVDALRARSLREPAHQGSITLEVHNPPGRSPTLIVSDDGVGLTPDEVHRFLATIGESSKRAKDGEPPVDFIGQFGIGILSCFVVSDEIVVISRSAHAGTPALEWRGRPDGTYSLKTLDRDLAPGTQVCLTGKADRAELFAPDRVAELARHYGGLLPYPIRLVAGKANYVVNEGGAPWRRKYSDERQRSRALLAFGKEAFGADFLEAIPLRSAAGDVDGVAFVLPHTVNLAARRTHRVYLKNMLLSEDADNLLPEWAFFVKCVVNANDLRPTASRESFYEDDKLRDARDALGACLRSYLVGLAKHDPQRLDRLIGLHALAIKALAVQDEEFYRLFIDWLPFETSLGTMTFGEYRKEHSVVRYAPHVDSFRQIARVAAAQDLCVINAGYTYDAELLARAPDAFPELTAEVVEPAGLTQSFDDLTLQEQEQAHDFLTAADAALRPFRCAAEVKKFLPRELPALYSTTSEGRFLRSLEQSQEIASPLWAGVLGNIGKRERAAPGARLCFNFHNALVRQLAEVRDRALVQRSVQMLYVQALLLGHHPLNAKEMGLLNEGLLAMIEWGLKAREGGKP